MRGLRALVATTMVLLLVPALASTPAGASRPAVSRQRFCVPTKVIIDDVQKPVLDIAGPRDAVLALTLNRTAKAAPKTVARSMRTMASTYTALGKATTDADRAGVAFAKAAKFVAAQKVVVAYYSTHCVTTPVSSPSFGPVNAANLQACLTDLDVIKLAETEYSTLNGGYGTMAQLVAAGFLRSASQLHPEVTVGTPPGGYTVVGNQVCNDTPVAG